MTKSPSFFEGVPPEERDAVLKRLERRHYPAGADVIAEGETCRELYLVQSGSAEVFVADRAGVEHLVGSVSPGATLGEMSLFTGRPAAGTVRARDDLELLVLKEADFERIGSLYPQVYRNLGALLSERLAVTNRLTLGEEPGRLAVLEDMGAPPELAYALACSVAWHTRGSTLLLVVDQDPPDVLEALAVDEAVVLQRAAAPKRAGRAHVLVTSPSGRYAPEALARTTEDLCAQYEHVLVLTRGKSPAQVEAFRNIRLSGPDNGQSPDAPAGYAIEAWHAGDGRARPDAVGLLSVPPLRSKDESALRDGRLPTGTPAGNALGWAARDLSGIKVGLALGAGSVRAFAHWGVLQALEEMGVPIDYIAGSSAGGAAAALYASGLRGAEGIDVLLKAAPVLFRPTLPVKSLLSSRALARFLHTVHGDTRFEDLDPPTAVVTTDIRARRSVVLRRGRVDRAVLATLAIPGIYPAQRSGSYILVDGGVLDPVPIGVAADMGANVVIGVQLLGRPNPGDANAQVEDRSSSARQPSALSTIMRSIEIMQTRVSPDPVDATSILLTPKLENIPSMKLRNFASGVRYVESGAAETFAARPRIAAALPWLRPS